MLWLFLLGLIQPALGSISGVVVEARTGAALAAVLVKIESTGQQAFSDTEGRFEIAGVAAGPQTLLVSVVGYGLVRRDLTVLAGETASITIPVAEGASTYVEEVTVAASLFRQAESGIASQAVLGSRDLLALRGVMADDPFRAVQVLPTVATGDDFRAEFAVRGLGPRHTGIALDGVDSPLLFHTVRGVEDSGSLALINSDILDSASLLSGAYPQRAGAHLGSRLDFTTRDGSRDRVHGRALVSATAATTVWEGPLGDGSGAWLGAFRQSYIDWLIRKIDPEAAGTFGFTDAQGRVTLDLTPRQTLNLTFIGGRSIFTEHEENPGPGELDTARNRTLIGNLQWRFTPSTRWSLSQQIYAVDAKYENRTTTGGVREEGGDRDITWRGSLELVPAGRHTIEIGGQAQAFRSERVDRTFTGSRVITNLATTDRYSAGAAWVHYRWNPSPTVLISPGARVEHMSIAGATVGSPWLLAEWQATPVMRVRGSAGVQHQPPTFDQRITAPPAITLSPERASTLDLGVERRVGEAWRVSLGAYYRREQDRLRFEDSEVRLGPGGGIIRPQRPFWINAMSGDAHGAELTVEHRSANGVSGWISYAYGRNELDDELSGERFLSDYDQTHMVNAYGIYRTSGRLSFSSKLRYGSNFPLTGYYQQVNGAYFVGPERNTVRLPYYMRVDLRGDWAFTYRHSRATLFVELVNALGRVNYRPGDQFVIPGGAIFEPIEKLFPFLPSAGILIEF